jgi:predicted metal-binding protein
MAPGATRPSERVFFCRTCHRNVTSTDPPEGWHRLQIRSEALQRRNSQNYATVGLYCSPACLRAWAAANDDQDQAADGG